MKTESIKSELIGLEEINQNEREEICGGAPWFPGSFGPFGPFIVCCYDIPPMTIFDPSEVVGVRQA